LQQTGSLFDHLVAPEGARVSKSAVSRRFVALPAERM
jgi:hypothetical protein